MLCVFIRMNHFCKILCSFCFSWHCEMPTYQCREWKYMQYGEQRCRWGVFVVNSCDDQESEAHGASFEECPVTARLNLNVSWYISITKQKIPQRGSRSNSADGSLSPCRSSLLTCRLQTGSEQGGSSLPLRHSLPYVTVLPELPSLTCSHAQHKQNLGLKDVCQAEHVFLFSLLSRKVIARFFLCSLQFFITCKSLVFS